MTDEKDEVFDILKNAGYEVIDLTPDNIDICSRCGLYHRSFRMEVCFVCGMWEDPDSSDKEIDDAIFSAIENDITYKNWLAGRIRFGKLVPSEHQQKRIQERIQSVIKFKISPWILNHKEGKPI